MWNTADLRSARRAKGAAEVLTLTGARLRVGRLTFYRAFSLLARRDHKSLVCVYTTTRVEIRNLVPKETKERRRITPPLRSYRTPLHTRCVNEVQDADSLATLHISFK
jgi:hypothetical protein